MIKWPSTCTCCKGGDICSLQLSAAGGDEGFCQDYVAPPEGTIVRFHLNTYSQKDRLIVTSNPTNPCAPNIGGATGDVLLDTGCVGTGGYIDYDALIPAGSTIVRVIVIPNCEGGSGTSWDFTSSCIEPVCPFGEYGYIVEWWAWPGPFSFAKTTEDIWVDMHYTNSGTDPNYTTTEIIANGPDIGDVTVYTGYGMPDGIGFWLPSGAVSLRFSGYITCIPGEDVCWAELLLTCGTP